MEEKSEFELCKICKINHNQGRRHNFFPRHKSSLSSLFSRFQEKLSDVRFSLKNPTIIRPSEASSNGIWCIFCDSDIDEHGSTFTSGNAIKHFASKDHLKNLKHFLWKYGGGMNKVDAFRITDAELAKWEKRCKTLKDGHASSSAGYCDALHGQTNDIRPNFEIMNSFDQNCIQFVESNVVKNVMPLQYDTNENYQVYHSDISGRGKVGSFPQVDAPSTSLVSQNGMSNWNSTRPGHNTQDFLPSGTNSLVGGFSSTDVCKNQGTLNGELLTNGHHNRNQISYVNPEDAKGNVHSGAPPPWLEGTEVQDNHGLATDPTANYALKNKRKAIKLNPNRVGAAWADRRKLEMEMEKRGEIIARDSDADWLPNFGRVWQSGTRKESMKEFKKEKFKPTAESQAEGVMNLRPYISKRTRGDTKEGSSEGIHSD